VDNADSELFTITGTWGGPSTWTGGGAPYEGDYRWHLAGTGSDTVTWTPDIPSTADYYLFSWWSKDTTRVTNAPYTINYNGGSTLLNVNQETGGGMWSLLGIYNFAAGITGNVVLSDNSDQSGEYIIADAVGFYNAANNPPFTAKGEWTLNTNATDIYRYGPTHKWIINETADDVVTWTPDIPSDGQYMLFSWWKRDTTGNINRAADAPYTIYHSGGSTTIDMNQNQGGGCWQYIDTFTFSAGTSHRIELSGDAEADMYVMADAVAFTNTTNNVSFFTVGEWTNSKYNANTYGGFIHFSEAGNGSDVATWIPDISEDGEYEVYAWWTTHANRATDAPYTIYYNGGTQTDTVDVNQEINGSRWNYLGTYYFTAGTDNKVELSDDAAGGQAGQYVMADAVAFTQGGPPPTDPSNVTITNNTIKGNNGIGVAVDSLVLSSLDIEGNNIYSQPLGGLAYSSIAMPTVVTFSNNTLDNSGISSDAIGMRLLGDDFASQTPVISYNTVNNFGANAIQAKNFPGGMVIDSNDISLNNRSGLSLSLVNGVSIYNNYVYSNGVANTIINGLQDASGIRARDSAFAYVADNTIRNNMFAGIASYSSPGTIGPDNVIMFDGDPESSPGEQSGSLENCVITGGVAGNVRGGIMVRDLDQSEEMTVMCTNTLYSNYWENVAKIGGGNVYSCGNAVASFFAEATDTVYWLQGPTTYNLDCNESASNTIDAAGKPFGIIILGSSADVTVQNCTIKNAAMNSDYWIDTGDGTTVGAGIFIANNATPSIANNYVFSNGWGILEDSAINSNSAGIMMRCAATV
jgi:hypothetical protein